MILVTLYPIALGAQNGELLFTVGLDSVNHVATASDCPVQAVPVRDLDSLADDLTPVMMKLDVEGYEEEVLRGSLQLLKRPELKVLEIESVTPWITSRLQQKGFRRAYYSPWTPDP